MPRVGVASKHMLFVNQAGSLRDSHSVRVHEHIGAVALLPLHFDRVGSGQLRPLQSVRWDFKDVVLVVVLRALLVCFSTGLGSRGTL